MEGTILNLGTMNPGEKIQLIDNSSQYADVFKTCQENLENALLNNNSAGSKDIKLVQSFFNTETNEIKVLLSLIDDPSKFREQLEKEEKFREQLEKEEKFRKSEENFSKKHKEYNKRTEGYSLKSFIIDSLAAVAIGLVGYGAFRLYKMGFRQS
ncbi:MAG: hypothetical protein JSR80_02805 [Verrucomicrobia bacterium]|nr:hypothetical protein [Verrucomicrobiota bacterium]